MEYMDLVHPVDVKKLYEWSIKAHDRISELEAENKKLSERLEFLNNQVDDLINYSNKQLLQNRKLKAENAVLAKQNFEMNKTIAHLKY